VIFYFNFKTCPACIADPSALYPSSVIPFKLAIVAQGIPVLAAIVLG